MTDTVANAVAQRDEDRTPGGMVRKYSDSFAAVLPSQVNPVSWVRIAQGALKKGKRLPSGAFELEMAATNNPGVFMATLLDAARLGLEPGTEQYYLTARKVQGRLEILGIIGYQGHIDLMYRAGAVSAVVAEVVRANDEYRYQRGLDDMPVHRFTPFAREAERGPLIGAYAYARMKDGSISRVVELNRDDIDRIKRSSQGSDSEYSPWQKFEAAMWLKSAVRQLQKWVPTSAEYRRTMMDSDAQTERVAAKLPVAGVAEAVTAYRTGDALIGEVVDDDAPDDDGSEA